MAKTIDIDLIINTAGSERSVAQAKEAIIQLQREISKVGNSADDAFVNKTNKAIVQSQNQLKNLKDEIQSVQPQQLGTAFLTIGQSIAGSFQLATGAIAAFGGESKEIEKVQTQLLAVTNIAGGLGNLKDSTENFGKAFQVVNTIIKANPIGALIVGITGLIAVLGVLYESENKEAEVQERINKEKKIRLDLDKQLGKESVDISNNLINVTKKRGDVEAEVARNLGKSEAEVLNIKRKSLEEQLNQSEINAVIAEGNLKRGIVSEEQVLAEYQRQRDLADQIKVIDSEIIGNKNKVIQENAKNQQAANEKAKQALQAYNESIKQLNSESLNEFQKISEEEFNKKQELQTQFDNLTLKQRTERQTEFDEKIRQIELDAITKTNELKKQKEDEAIQAEKDKQKKLSDVRQLGFENQLLQLELDGQLTKEKELEIERQKFEDLKLLTVEGSEEQKALILEYKETLLRINKEYNEKELEDDKKKEEQKARNLQFGVQSAIQTANLISNIATSFAGKSEKAAKKAFNISKAAQIASALGATYLSATQAFASQFLPIPDPSSPVRGGIAAGLAVAAGLANVAKISQTKFEGGNTNPGGTTPPSGDLGGGNIPANATPITPQASIANQQIGAINQQGFKVFVTETDITSVINKVDVIESQSKFG